MQINYSFNEFLKDFAGEDFKLTISQNELLSFVEDNNFNIIYKNRNQGITKAIDLYIFWKLLSNSGFQIGVLCCGYIERENFRNLIYDSIEKLPEFFKDKYGIDNWKLTGSKHTIHNTEFPNGSRIYYWTKTNSAAGRGYNLDFLYVSELNYYENYPLIVDVLTIGLKKNGKAILTTTDMRNIKEEFRMNGDGISEYWSDALFSGKRQILFEKTKKNFLHIYNRAAVSVNLQLL